MTPLHLATTPILDLKTWNVTLMVAASDASNGSKSRADYLCDGVNDEVQIQAAIDALPTAGGRVILSEGTFTVSWAGELTSPEGFISPYCVLITYAHPPLTIEGVPGATIVKLANTQPNKSASFLVRGVAGNIRTNPTYFIGLQLDGNASNQGAGTSDLGPISMMRANDVTIQNCRIVNWKSAYSGIWAAYGSQNIRILNNYLEGETSFIRIHNASCIITNNLFYSSLITGSMLEMVVDEVGFGTAHSVIVTNNLFIGGFQHITLQGCHSCIVSENTCRDAIDTYAIAIKISEYDGGPPLQYHGNNNVVIGNTIYNCAIGIMLGGGATYGSRNNIVAFNTILDGPTATVLYGIFEVGAANLSNQIVYNYVDPSAVYPISAAGAGVVVRDNTGWVTVNQGAAATVADGGTIDHGLAAVPTMAVVSGSVAGEMATVTTLDATHITVAIKKHDGSAGTTQTIYWRAQV